MRRLITGGCAEWSLAVTCSLEERAEEPVLSAEQRSLDRFSAQAALLGLKITGYLIVCGARYAWLEPSELSHAQGGR